ncbi:MAG TPA: alcohol dehydrogenase catalytic domain-containing protein [Candidatus Limnocylindrales bacterium]
MKALVFTGPSRVEVQDVDEPVAGEDEVVVDVRAVGICGSELHGVRRPGFRVPPLVMGHEFAGTTSDGVDVIVNPILSCGTCDLCALGLTQVCSQRRIIGIHRPGAFAERVAVPRAALHRRPDGVSWKAAAVVEPAATAVHAWGLGSAGPGARVGIIGAGTIGLACLIVALGRGAGSVEIADRSAIRLAAAERLGAARTGDELTGTYDVVFDAVGSAATHRQSLARVRSAGTAVWLGLAEDASDFDSLDLIRAEKRVVGSFAYTDEEFAATTQLVRDWDLDWTATFPLADGAEIFTALMNGGMEPIKALLLPGPREAEAAR